MLANLKFLLIISNYSYHRGGASLSDDEHSTLRGWGTQRGHAVRDMYLTAGVMAERGTQRGLTLGDRYLNAGLLVEIVIKYLTFFII